MNLVNELQVSAEQDDVLTVLRKTRRLASKLGRKDITDWLESEQSGYAKGNAIPDYRKIGTTLAYNTNGYVPVGWGHAMKGIVDLPANDMTFPLDARDPISTIMTWIEATNKGGGPTYPIPLGSDYDNAIRSCFHFDPTFADQITFVLRLNPAQVKAIPERIKDTVLNWACALEAARVHGENQTFDENEKRIGHNITINISHSQIEQLNNLGTNRKG